MSLRIAQSDVREDGLSGNRAKDEEETNKEFFHIKNFF
jgi:hypothetical protein